MSLFPLSVHAEETVSFATEKLVIETSSGRHELIVEVARTAAEQAQGLMYRQNLALDHGMLFVLERPREAYFWMRNTLIPLDILFIDSSNKVHHIALNAEPLSEALIASQGVVHAVLELNGGQAKALGIRVGDTILSPSLPAR
jgi:uncharacterized protein